MPRTVRRALGWLVAALGAWMLVSPQAALGLEQLRWVARYAFPGEVLLGILVLSAGYWLLDLRSPLAAASAPHGAHGAHGVPGAGAQRATLHAPAE